MILSATISPKSTTTAMWQWQEWRGLPYLTCQLLDSWQHGFFTQHCYPLAPDILIEALRPNAQAYRVKQVHGDRILTPSDIKAQMTSTPEEDNHPPADGIITESSPEGAWVASADCTPALIGDVQTGRVAAVHAGWRGTAQRILPKTIERFLSMGSSLENLRVALGPAIAGEVYQVTETVAAEVGKTLLQNSQIEDKEAILAILEALPDSLLLPDSQAGRVRLDVRQVNALQLAQMGIQGEQMAIAPHCTYQESEHFFSYRRTKGKKVQWSGIVS